MSITPGQVTWKNGAISGAGSLSTDPVTTQVSGSTFVFLAILRDPAVPDTIIDTFGNIFSLEESLVYAFGNATISKYVCINGVGGAGHSVTATWSSAAPLAEALGFLELPGMGAATIGSNPTGTQGSFAGAPTVLAAPTIAAAIGECIVNCWVGFTDVVTAITNGGVFSLLLNHPGSNPANLPAAISFLQAGSAATFGDTFTSDQNDGPVCVAISFIPGFVPTSPTINTQPASQSAPVGGTETFTIAATTSGGTLSYQWKLNGSNVGTNSSTYTTGTLASTDNASLVTCVVTDSNGSTNSLAARIWITGLHSGAGLQSDLRGWWFQMKSLGRNVLSLLRPKI